MCWNRGFIAKKAKEQNPKEAVNVPTHALVYSPVIPVPFTTSIDRKIDNEIHKAISSGKRTTDFGNAILQRGASTQQAVRTAMKEVTLVATATP